jgi:ActR/RegA family two-component response regulator
MPKPRILIVDDDQGTLASLSRAFALEGYTALTSTKRRWTPSSPTW